MHENLTALPERITQGTAVDYRRTLSEFPASAGWSMTLYIAGAAVLSEAATVDGDSFLIALANAETATLTPGVYQWEERVTKAGKTYVADSGVVEVLANIATATAGSLQSFNSKMLAAVEGAIGIRLGIGSAIPQDVIEQYEVGSRSITKMSLRELYDLRSRLRLAVRNEANPGKLGPQVRVVFPSVNAEPESPWQ